MFFGRSKPLPYGLVWVIIILVGDDVLGVP